jgi:hypothetical protein
MVYTHHMTLLFTGLMLSGMVGDEMTRIIWKLIRDTVNLRRIPPFCRLIHLITDCLFIDVGWTYQMVNDIVNHTIFRC